MSEFKLFKNIHINGLFCPDRFFCIVCEECEASSDLRKDEYGRIICSSCINSARDRQGNEVSD